MKERNEVLKNNISLKIKHMKKVILILLLMIFNINSLMRDSHAEYSHAAAKPLYRIVEKQISVKNLLEESSMIDIMRVVNDSMLIDKINIFEYKESLAMHETGNIANPYLIVNRYGYAGKYQFGKSTLRTLRNVKLIEFDIDKQGRKVFLADSALQERTLNALLIYNLNYAKKKNLLKYVGKKFHGTTITIEGILAGSHLVGATAVCHYLENNGSLEDFYIQGVKCRKYDGNGVSVVDYMKIFQNV